ncbi:hypothetical protein EGW08_009121, partial [Elysia chlorotica]
NVSDLLHLFYVEHLVHPQAIVLFTETVHHRLRLAELVWPRQLVLGHQGFLSLAVRRRSVFMDRKKLNGFLVPAVSLGQGDFLADFLCVRRGGRLHLNLPHEDRVHPKVKHNRLAERPVDVRLEDDLDPVDVLALALALNVLVDPLLAHVLQVLVLL